MRTTVSFQVWFGILKWKLWEDGLLKTENCVDWMVSLSFERAAGCSECKLLAMGQTEASSLGRPGSSWQKVPLMGDSALKGLRLKRWQFIHMPRRKLA